ncbi:MAG TPA: ABC transporter permease [Panacibacter sp.]|nr:ABC transporter permease [Panacibacter sp.]
MLNFYIKSAVRSISRKKIFSVLNIAGLAIGISVFMLTLEYYSYETGFNTFHKNLPNLYRINIAQEEGKISSTMSALGPAAEKNIPGIKAAARFGDNFNSGAIVTYQPGSSVTERKSFREEGAVFVDKSFLDIFNFPLIAGTNELDKPNTVIVNASVAKKLFGNENAVGKTIQLHNQFGLISCAVCAVLNDLPKQSDIQFDYLFSMESLNNASYIGNNSWATLDNWGVQAFGSYLLLKDGVNPSTVAAAATKLYQQNKPEYSKADGVLELQPVSELHLGNSMKDNSPTAGSMAMVYFIFALGILVLCIAWINYINFSTAHAISQAKNIGIHKIIGSGKKQIVLRYITEAFILNIVSLAIAFLIVMMAQGLFNYVTGKPLSLEYINHPATWLTAAGIMATGILLCGGYVGFVLSRFKPINTIRFNDNGRLGNVLLRKGLVIFQFVISILFITATIIAYDQLQFMKNSNLGMNINNLVVIDGPSIREGLSENSNQVFMNELQKLPFIEKESQTGCVPGIGYGYNFSTGGVTNLNPSKADKDKNYNIALVDENYFPTYQIAFTGGRNFTTAEADKGFKGDKVMINEAAEKSLHFAPGAAVNQMIKWNDNQYQVVAVVKDYHHKSLKELIEPIVFFPQHNDNNFTVKMSTDHLPEKIAAIKSVYNKIYAGNPFQYKLLKEAYDTQYTDEQKSGTLALSISVLVILIACLGLIGLSIFTAKRRTKEIGIRKVLGASVNSLFTLLSKEFLWLVVIAFAISTPLAWWAMNNWLQNFAYRTTISWWVFAIAGLSALSIALITVSFQSIRAAIANPVKSLRTE